MGSRTEFDLDTEILVQQVKDEMIKEGLRYQGNLIGRPRVLDKERRVKSKVKEVSLNLRLREDDWPIQFRGTPRVPDNPAHNMRMVYKKDFKPLLKGSRTR